MSAQPKTGDADLDAKITDADVERCKRQIGVTVPVRGDGKNFTPIPDASSMSHFAFGLCGDPNPLWHDPEYGAATRWGGQIAPPTYPISAGITIGPEMTAELKALFRGLFRGVGKYYSGVRWEWYRPIYPGDSLFHEHCTSDVQVKPGRFSGRNQVTETYRALYFDRVGTPVCARYESYVNAERSGSREAGKNKDIKRQTYTDEDIKEVDAVYAAEELRGATPRYWEDVEVGDQLVPVAKGPTTVLDVISSHIGMGWGGYGLGPLRYAWEKRTHMPAFYVKDEYGVPDVVQRLHWQQDWAEKLGLPAPYDYGQMRTAWLCHLVTNWMGDDAWLWKLQNYTVAFNFLGDFHKMTGEIVAKRREGVHCVVDLKIEGTNQRGMVTCPGTATIILPSREHGPVVLPLPPQELVGRAAHAIAGKAERDRRRASK